MGLTGRRKRAREEEQGAPMAPRARSSNPAPAPAAPQAAASFHEAIQFVLAVRRELAGEPGKYEEFLAVLREHKSVGTVAVVDRVKVLFAGHPDLLREFDRFVPRNQQGTSSN